MQPIAGSAKMAGGRLRRRCPLGALGLLLKKKKKKKKKKNEVEWT